MTEHILKTWPAPFEAVRLQTKRHEIRKDDRPFKVGDVLELREWHPETELYSGRRCRVTVTYMTHGGQWGLPYGLVVMSIDVQTTCNVHGPYSD